MDGAVVLSTDGNRILRANVQLVPDPSIPTDESGTRHRSAERAAAQTGYPVISVSHSMSIVTVYLSGERHVLADSATILSRANQAIATLERYKTRLDEVSRQLSRAEIEDFVSLRDVMTVVQRLELVRRIGVELDYEVVELGTDGRQLRLQLDELLGGNDAARELDRARLPRQPRAPPTPKSRPHWTSLDAMSDTSCSTSRQWQRSSATRRRSRRTTGREPARLPGADENPPAPVRASRSPGPRLRHAAGPFGGHRGRPGSRGRNRRDLGPPRARRAVAVGRIDHRRSAQLTLDQPPGPGGGPGSGPEAGGPGSPGGSGGGTAPGGGAWARMNGTAAERRFPS